MRIVWCCAVLLMVGCAVKQPPVVPFVPPPVPPLPLPAVTEPLVAPDPPGEASETAIQHANDRALMRPTRQDFIRAEVVFPYKRGAIYQITGTLHEPIDLILQPGERLLKYISGDKRWEKDISEGIDPVHISVMATRPQLRSRMTLITTHGTYYLQMRAHPSIGLAAVSWRHPVPVMEPPTGLYGIGYGVPEGVTQTWAPLYAWDYEGRSYLLFHERLPQMRAPVVMVAEGETRRLVNYRPSPSGRVYIVDHLLDGGEVLELRMDAESPTVVVSRTEEARMVRCPGDEACRVMQRYTPGVRRGE